MGDGVKRTGPWSLVSRWLALVALGFAVWNVAHRLIATQVAASDSTRVGLDAAIAWDPLNPELNLARAKLTRDALQAGGDAEVRADLERAIELNPWNWSYWGELATLLEVDGDLEGAGRAYRRAANESPLSGYTRWNLANFHLRRGNRQDWLKELGAAVKLEHSYRDPAALLLLKMGVSPEEVDAFWPATREALLPLMRFLVERAGDSPPDLAGPAHLRHLWTQILDSPGPLEPRDGQFYLDYLLHRGLYQEARSSWAELMAHNGVSTASFVEKKNYVWNGDFEVSPCNRIFCWLFEQSTDYSIHWAKGKDENFSSQIRIEFAEAENIFFQGLRQNVVVDPDNDYELSFRSRAEALSGDRGIYLQIRDPQTGLTAGTEEVLGTQSWKKQSVGFHVPAGSNLVTVTFRRERSRRLGGKLSGTIWLDDVSLRRVDESSGQR